MTVGGAGEEPVAGPGRGLRVCSGSWCFLTGLFSPYLPTRSFFSVGPRQDWGPSKQDFIITLDITKQREGMEGSWLEKAPVNLGFPPPHPARHFLVFVL